MVSDIPRGVRSDATHQTEATYICLHHKMFTEKVISCGCKWGIANNTVETERERKMGRLRWKTCMKISTYTLTMATGRHLHNAQGTLGRMNKM